MHPIIKKTLGGLSPQYYFRQLFFSLVMAALFYFAVTQNGASIHAGHILFVLVSTLLYPYSRFVYESIMDFLTGKNVFFVNATLMMGVKLITMLVCWSFAIFIAPVGLAYLYYHHSKA